MRTPSLLHLLLGLATAPLVCAGQPSSEPGTNLLKDVQRIVFLGDSITQKGDFIVDVECWLLSRGIQVEVLNLGLGSESAATLTPEENKGHLAKYGFGKPAVSERLSRVLAETKPDMLFVCYGMNDAAMAENEDGTRRFGDALTAIRRDAIQAGVKRMIFCTPPVHDNKQSADTDPADRKLSRYSEWLMEQRKEGWQVVDIHAPMRLALEAARKANPSFTFAEDGVHPNRSGHWLMARQILEQAFGASTESLTSAEEFFKTSGKEIRELVRQRMALLAAAWLTQTRHTRPYVPGGPQSQPGLPVDEAERKAKALTEQISAILQSSHAPNDL